jgi:hypothetical protein
MKFKIKAKIKQLMRKRFGDYNLSIIKNDEEIEFAIFSTNHIWYKGKGEKELKKYEMLQSLEDIEKFLRIGIE